MTRDYYRHATTTLFAVFNVLDGSAISQCKPRHRHQEFLVFLDQPRCNVLENLATHLAADDYPHSQTCQGQSPSRAPAAQPYSLCSDLLELAQSNRARWLWLIVSMRAAYSIACANC